MLDELMENAGRVVSRQRLFDEVWEGEVDIRSNAIDVHISRLRSRLGSSARGRHQHAARAWLPPGGDRPGTRMSSLGWPCERTRDLGDRPIVTRLVVAVAAAMAVVLVLAAAFVYWRVSSPWTGSSTRT